MQLLHEVESTLRSAGFRTARDRNLTGIVVFEDDTILGFVAVYDTADGIVSNWRVLQDEFLKRNAVHLRRDPQKAWNTYSIFLTDDEVDQLASAALEVEADVHATRKILRGGVATKGDVQSALAPILPLALVGGAQVESVDEALDHKLDEDQRTLFKFLSEREVPEPRIVSWLLEVTR
jgi:hypothetical protein